MVYSVSVRNRFTGGTFVYETTASSEKEALKNAQVRFAKEMLNGMTPKRFFGKRKKGRKTVRIADRYEALVV